MATISLRRRFFTHTAVIALVVMLASMLVVDISYRGELERSTREKLQLQIFSLLSVAQLTSDAYIPDIMSNPDFNRLGSGHWLLVADQNKQPIWHSLSIEESPALFSTSEVTGVWQYDRVSFEQAQYLTASYLVASETDLEQTEFHLVAGENVELIQGTIVRFRLWLFGGFFLTTLLLMGFQYWGLRGAFRPIASLEKEIAMLEKGEQHHLKAEYPKELRGVTKNLNSLIDMEHRYRERYRSGMADLAHSLKTPLAVILGEQHKYSNNQTMVTAVERINTNIEYQLRRAVIADHQLQTRGTDILQVIESVVSALNKLHRDRPVQTDVLVKSGLRFRGDENDLTEVLGNLLDNAFKYASERIQISASYLESAHETKSEPKAKSELIIQVEDDGPGLCQENATRIFTRGERLDDQGLGQGIGLAVVYEIVKSYQGQILVERSALGGALFTLSFPTGVLSS